MSARPDTGPAMPQGIDELILPGISPTNVRASGRFRVEGVTNDLYSIAERLKELNDRLFINMVEDKQNDIVFYAIMEATPVGDQLVFKCTRLDPRVIEHVRYLLKVPFADRFAKAEAEATKYEAAFKDNEMEDLVERLGLPMMRELRECGFLGAYAKSDAARGRKRFGAGG